VHVSNLLRRAFRAGTLDHNSGKNAFLVDKLPAIEMSYFAIVNDWVVNQQTSPESTGVGLHGYERVLKS
jgi:hypothetical protein